MLTYRKQDNLELLRNKLKPGRSAINIALYEF